MLGPVLDWLATARQCFADDAGQLQRGLLTSAFALVVGLERIWHLDEMDDPGFALLTGGRRCPARHARGAGGGTCAGTRWTPSAAAPAPGNCSPIR
jgi:hypothetical protein